MIVVWRRRRRYGSGFDLVIGLRETWVWVWFWKIELGFFDSRSEIDWVWWWWFGDGCWIWGGLISGKLMKMMVVGLIWVWKMLDFGWCWTHFKDDDVESGVVVVWWWLFGVGSQKKKNWTKKKMMWFQCCSGFVFGCWESVGKCGKVFGFWRFCRRRRRWRCGCWEDDLVVLGWMIKINSNNIIKYVYIIIKKN